MTLNLEVRICSLPEMRMLSSRKKDFAGKFIDDMGDGMQKWADSQGLQACPGMREVFAFYDETDQLWEFIRSIPKDFINKGEYRDFVFEGGLFAVTCGVRDELEDKYKLLMEWIENNERYELDTVEGKQRWPAMCDWLTPQDIHKKYDYEQQDIFVPIRLRRDL